MKVLENISKRLKKIFREVLRASDTRTFRSFLNFQQKFISIKSKFSEFLNKRFWNVSTANVCVLLEYFNNQIFVLIKKMVVVLRTQESETRKCKYELNNYIFDFHDFVSK